ncbi:hypothetical protein [Mycobacterium lehmannii]|uniref:hypothetical protein n=1 Tax=Mycobacterium lehmannii TaxID=2048550 RepID=UPI001E3FD390|nr:hypothetical protein [Mycobacterium lehmannii]
MSVQADADHGSTLARHRSGRSVLAVVFLLLFVFSYSEEVVAAVLEAIDQENMLGWLIGLVGLDAAVLAVVGLLKRGITAADGGVSRLWRPWWVAVGAVLGLDVLLCLLPEDHPLWLHLTFSVAMAILMGLVMALSLNADPMTILSGTRRAAAPTDWMRVRAVVPLVVGAFVCYLAATAFNDFFDLDTQRALDPELAAEVHAMPLPKHLGAMATLCEGAVSPAFFYQVVAVIPLLLLTLGVEFNFFRRALAEPVQRAAAAATVTVVSIGLVLALSTLPFAGIGCGQVWGYWHEFLAFVVSVQGLGTGLATLVWVLLVSDPDRRLVGLDDG